MKLRIFAAFVAAIAALMAAGTSPCLGRSSSSSEREFTFTCKPGERCDIYVVPDAPQPNPLAGLKQRLGRVENTLAGHGGTMDRHEDQLKNKPTLGDWSLSIGVPAVLLHEASVVGFSGQFIGDLRIAPEWFFHFQGGPGVSWLDGDEVFTVSEFVGCQWRAISWLSLTLGGRHHIAFWADGDLVNALLAEIQVRFTFRSVSFVVFGGMGNSWYPKTTQPVVHLPAGAAEEVPPPVTKTSSAFTGEVGAALEWRF